MQILHNITMLGAVASFAALNLSGKMMCTAAKRIRFDDKKVVFGTFLEGGCLFWQVGGGCLRHCCVAVFREGSRSD